jgi:hypothetical protein
MPHTAVLPIELYPPLLIGHMYNIVINILQKQFIL